MGSACCKRKRETRHVPIQGETLRTADITQATILMTGSNFETTMFPWQSTRLKKKHVKNIPEDDTVYEAISALATERPQTDGEKSLLMEALKHSPALAGLSKEVHHNLLDSMKAYDVDAYQLVYEQKTEAATFFIVTKGRLEELTEGERIQELAPGDAFGDSALLYDQPRRKTVKTLESSTMWGLDRTLFKQAVAQYNAMIHLENLSFLRSIKMLESLTDEQVEDLVEALSTHIYPSGATIVTEGATDSILYIIKEGTVSCSCKGLEIRKMSRGDYFGEQALLYDTPRTASVSAVTDVRVLSITRDKLQEKLGGTLQHVMYKNSIRIAFSHHPVLRHLTASQREDLVDLTQTVRVTSGETVNVEGTLVVVLRGTLRNRKETVDRLAVLEGSESIVALDECELAVLSRLDAEAHLNGSFEALATENQSLSFLRNVSLCRSFSTEKLKTLLSVRTTAGAEDRKLRKGEEDIREG